VADLPSQPQIGAPARRTRRLFKVNIRAGIPPTPERPGARRCAPLDSRVSWPRNGAGELARGDSMAVTTPAGGPSLPNLSQATREMLGLLIAFGAIPRIVLGPVLLDGGTAIRGIVIDGDNSRGAGLRCPSPDASALAVAASVPSCDPSR